MKIVEATRDDGPAVVALWRACDLTRPWNDAEADFARAIDGATSTVLIGHDGDAIVGSVMVGCDGHRGWAYYLAVAPAARRHGVGRALMAQAQTWLRARGVPKIQVMVRDDNADAPAFYRALGFEAQPVTTWGLRLEGEI